MKLRDSKSQVTDADEATVADTRSTFATKSTVGAGGHDIDWYINRVRELEEEVDTLKKV